MVPTFNEQATVEKAVGGALDAGTDVLVVDDGSTDQTSRIVQRLASTRAGVHLLQRGHKQGLGSAYRAGFRWGLDRGYAALGEMDADLSHDPADIPSLVAGLQVADLTIGSRYVTGGGVEDWPWSRRLLSRGGNLYVRAWTGLPVRDATAGFRLYRHDVLRSVRLDTIRSEGYTFQVEMALRTWRLGFDILEVPITFTERHHGVSKMSKAIVAEALWRVPLWAPGRRRPRQRHR